MVVFERLCHERFVNVAGQSAPNAAENKYLALTLSLFRVRSLSFSLIHPCSCLVWRLEPTIA